METGERCNTVDEKSISAHPMITMKELICVTKNEDALPMPLLIQSSCGSASADKVF